ncbi:hypothetical protein [Rugosimonospora africana]|uniref:Uncharacterized protein n=1 Tax=Rugosimonospora africana TaxID=556532 RepID=A0A8J3VWH2_9ACTN|nr:hypothetical protein [Rugosimonospora africana]GIH20846.1 hypothetical protein Raf01_90180 [Rugosimonospora africana]
MTTTSLVAVALAALLLLGLARVAVAGPHRDPAAGVVATHSVAGHTAPLLALRALRARTGLPRAAHPLGGVPAGLGLAVALLALAAVAGRRASQPARRLSAPDVRGPPRVAAR